MSKYKRSIKDPENFRKNIINIFDTKIKNISITRCLDI